MNIVIQYDSSAKNAPAGFQSAVQAAVNFYDNLISTPITVNIVFSYGEIEGQKISSNALGESDGNGWFLSYNQVVTDLAKTATSAADIQSVLAMLASDPTHGGTFWVTDAQAKAFGIIGNPNFIDPEDGFVGLTSSQPLNFAASNTSVAGQYSAVGVLEHEISEVLGRTSGLASSTYGGQSVYTPLDLFRYSAPGVRSLNQSAAYFSVSGTTLLNEFNGASSGADLGDWGSSVSGDAYGNGIAGHAGVVTSVDQLEMDVLGYTLSTTTTSSANPAAVTISYSQFAADTATLAAITAAFNLTVTGVALTNRAAVEAAAHVVAVGVSDTAANLSAGLDALNADGKVNAIVVSDNQALVVTTAEKAADARAISELVNANGTVAVVKTSASGGGGTAGGTPSVYTNTAANIAANLSSLNANSALTSVVISDSAPVVLSIAQWSSDGHLLAELSNQNSTPYALTLSDSAAQVSAYFDALNGAAHVKSILVSDNANLTLTASQALHDTAALGLLKDANGQATTLSVADTAAHLAANLSSLAGVAHLTSLTATDGGALSLSWSQYVQDGSILAKLQGAHTLFLTGAPGSGVTTETLSYGPSGVLLSETLSSAATTTVYAYAAGQTLTNVAGTETIFALAGNDTFVVASGASRETVTGFNTASDALSFSHTVFASSTAVLADASSDGHGGVMIHTSSTGYIDLAGVSLAQLKQHASDFHFF